VRTVYRAIRSSFEGRNDGDSLVHHAGGSTRPAGRDPCDLVDSRE
jgi:hypothetical protein